MARTKKDATKATTNATKKKAAPAPREPTPEESDSGHDDEEEEQEDEQEEPEHENDQEEDGEEGDQENSQDESQRGSDADATAASMPVAPPVPAPRKTTAKAAAAKKPAAKKPAKTQMASQNSSNGGGGKKKRKFKMSFSYHIYKVLKDVHVDKGISTQAMLVMDNFIMDMFEKIAMEAANLCKMDRRHGLTARHIQTAVRLLIPGELGKHSISEGTKAVVRYNHNKHENATGVNMNTLSQDL